MSRSRRRHPEPKARLPAPETPSATLHDATAVAQIADAGVAAIVAVAIQHGLQGDQWDPDALHPQIAEIIARALRGTPDWWAGRTAEGS